MPDKKERKGKNNLKNKYDSAWKEVLKKLFKDCLEFFFPDIHKSIDFTKEVVFLDKELKEISPHSSQSDRVADILAKVHLLKDDKIAYIGLILHVEVQGQQEIEFMDRMFTYYYRAYDKEKKEKIPVISLAILTDGNPNFRPDTFHFQFCGFEIRMKIPIVKILDYKSKETLIAKLETSHNPMVMVVKAQLKSIEVQGSDNQKKFEVTKELMRECGRKGYSRKEIRIMFRFFEWVIRLPEEYNNRLNAVYKEVEEETKMEFLTSFERVAMKKGKKKGKEEDAQKMLKKGFDINTIIEITGLKRKKLDEIKASMH